MEEEERRRRSIYCLLTRPGVWTYAWYWRFNMGKGHGDRLRLVLAI
jgi:hypothetical protein